MKVLGIDVSEHQGIIDWSSVKAAGIKFAIIRVGYGENYTSQDDKYFKRNADECTRLGIPFGVYIYSYATTTASAQSEAEHVLRLISNYKLRCPVYYDMEDGNTQGKLSSSALNNIANAFCESIMSKGYLAGVYANLYWWENKLTGATFKLYQKWVAQYNSSLEESSYAGAHGMWQYSSTGRVNGINENVDMNYCYVDYPALINSENRDDYDLERLVTYYGDIDACSAILVAQKYVCPLMKYNDYLVSNMKVKTMMQVGGLPGDTNRYVTAQNTVKLL